MHKRPPRRGGPDSKCFKPTRFAHSSTCQCRRHQIQTLPLAPQPALFSIQNRVQSISMAITCSTKGTVNIYYFFTHCRLFGSNNLTGTLHCFGNKPTMAKPSPWEQNRCAFSSRDTSKLVGRQEYHVTTDKELSGSSVHKGAPVLLSPPFQSLHPLSSKCDTFRGSSESTYSRLFELHCGALFHVMQLKSVKFGGGKRAPRPSPMGRVS